MKTSDNAISIFQVDDDKLFLTSLTHVLKNKFKNTINVASYTSGEACLAQLDHKPDIVILDYYLNTHNPKAMNGLEVLKKIKEESADTKVIMLSGQDKVDIAMDSIKYGAYDYVSKSKSAFVRTENAIRNIIYTIQLNEESWMYSKWNYLMGGSLLALLILDIMYYLSNH